MRLFHKEIFARCFSKKKGEKDDKKREKENIKENNFSIIWTYFCKTKLIDILTYIYLII